VRRGAAEESWLVVYANGRIEYHVENDGYRFVRRGAEARDEWIDLDFVKNNWPQLVDQVEAAVIELGASVPPGSAQQSCAEKAPEPCPRARALMRAQTTPRR
jgi:hypothetical protein